MTKIILEFISSFIIYGISFFSALGAGLLTANNLTYTLYRDFKTHYSTPVTIVLSSATWLILFATFGIFNAKKIFHYAVACRAYVQSHLDAAEKSESENIVQHWHLVHQLAQEYSVKQQNEQHYKEKIKHFGLPIALESQLITQYCDRGLQRYHHLEALKRFDLKDAELDKAIKHFTDRTGVADQTLDKELREYIQNCFLARAIIAEYLWHSHTKIILFLMKQIQNKQIKDSAKPEIERILRLYAIRSMFDPSAELELLGIEDERTRQEVFAIKEELDKKINHIRAHYHVLFSEAERLLKSNSLYEGAGRQFFKQQMRGLYGQVLQRHIWMKQIPEHSRARYLRFISQEELHYYRSQIEILRPHSHRTWAKIVGIFLGLCIAVAEGFVGYYGGMVVVNLLSLLASGFSSVGIQSALVGGAIVFPPATVVIVGSMIAAIVFVMGFTLITPALIRILEDFADRMTHKTRKAMSLRKKIQLAVIGLINLIAGAGVASLVFFMLQIGFPGLLLLTGTVALLLGFNVTVFRSELLYDWFKQIKNYFKGIPGEDGIAPTLSGKITVGLACLGAISVATVIAYGTYISLLSLTLWPVGGLGITLALFVGVVTGLSVIPLAIRSVYLMINPQSPIETASEPQTVTQYLEPLQNEMLEQVDDRKEIQNLIEGFTKSFMLDAKSVADDVITHEAEYHIEPSFSTTLV